MDITISQKKIKNIILAVALIVAILAIGAGGYTAWRNNLLERFLPKQEIKGMEPALNAAAAFYAPNLDGGYDAWLAQVCGGMSEDGCGLLRAMYGEVVWKAFEGSGARFVQSQAIILEDVEVLSNDHHIWKLGVTVLSVNPQGEQKTNQLQTYVQVSFNKESGTWLLERILFDQEIKQRYGVDLGVGQ
jgi:rhodanese-related sulfurtransferase